MAQVVYLDLRDHGRSAWGDPASWGLELAADDVRGFCDALGIARPVVYGHSLGGLVAMVYAARHPGHAGALVLQSTTARFDLGRLVEGFRRAGVDCPTLVCVGELDPVTPVAAARELAAALPDASSPPPSRRGWRGWRWSREPGTSPGRTPRIATGRSSPSS